jgi:hypothetical protein
MIADPRFHHGVDEGKQIAKSEKVTVEVPGVEKREGMWALARQCAKECSWQIQNREKGEETRRKPHDRAFPRVLISRRRSAML